MQAISSKAPSRHRPLSTPPGLVRLERGWYLVVHCDALVSLAKPLLTDYVASLKPGGYAFLTERSRGVGPHLTMRLPRTAHPTDDGA
jgi:hypothetical protein